MMIVEKNHAMGCCGQWTSTFLVPSSAITAYLNTSKMPAQTLSASLKFHCCLARRFNEAFYFTTEISWQVREIAFSTLSCSLTRYTLFYLPHRHSVTSLQKITAISDMGKMYPEYISWLFFFLFLPVWFHSWRWGWPAVFDLIVLQGPHVFSSPAIWQLLF